jgi:hypothetical protein
MCIRHSPEQVVRNLAQDDQMLGEGKDSHHVGEQLLERGGGRVAGLPAP